MSKCESIINNINYLPLLQRIHQKILSNLDMDAILSFILTETAETLQVDQGFILRLKYQNPFELKNHEKVIPTIKVEIVLDWIKNQGINHNRKLSSYQLSQSPLIVFAWKNSPKITSISSQEELQEILSQECNENPFPFDTTEIKSMIFVPLFGSYNYSESQPITLGFLIFYKHNNHIWTTSEIEMAKNIALQGSLSIIHQQTLQKVQSLVDERTTQLKISLDVQAKLSKKMSHHIDELKRLNDIKDNFIASMSDALRNPLANIKMGIKMLKLIDDTEKHKRYLEILETECEKEIRLVNNLLALQQLEVNNFDVKSERLFLDDILKPIQTQFLYNWSHKQLNLILNNKLEFIDTDFKSFELIIQELLQNAGKFSPPQHDVIVNIYRQNDQSILEFINISSEISQGEQEEMFNAFYQNKEDRSISNTGTGLGLALVKSLVENLHGSIAMSNIICENKQDYVTTFTISLPQLSS